MINTTLNQKEGESLYMFEEVKFFEKHFIET